MSEYLNQIASVLNTLCESEDVPMEAAYYGMCPETSLDTWNYFVFGRTKTSGGANDLDLQPHYDVSIIHEDYIPEGYIETVIEALDGVLKREKGSSIDYSYVLKGSTNVVIELATIHFVRPRKRC